MRDILRNLTGFKGKFEHRVKIKKKKKIKKKNKIDTLN
jgi:hypothetical protein